MARIWLEGVKRTNVVSPGGWTFAFWTVKGHHDLTGDLALEKVDLLLKGLNHPFHIGRRLVGDLPQSPELRVVFGTLVGRDHHQGFDAIPAVRERNIRQVNPECGASTGFFGPERRVFEPVIDRGPRDAAFFGHFFRVLACNFKPGTQMGALDVFVGERHRGVPERSKSGLFRCPNIGPLPQVAKDSARLNDLTDLWGDRN